MYHTQCFGMVFFSRHLFCETKAGKGAYYRRLLRSAFKISNVNSKVDICCHVVPIDYFTGVKTNKIAHLRVSSKLSLISKENTLSYENLCI